MAKFSFIVIVVVVVFLIIIIIIVITNEVLPSEACGEVL
jgi:hypothetical protein